MVNSVSSASTAESRVERQSPVVWNAQNGRDLIFFQGTWFGEEGASFEFLSQVNWFFEIPFLLDGHTVEECNEKVLGNSSCIILFSLGGRIKTPLPFSSSEKHEHSRPEHIRITQAWAFPTTLKIFQEKLQNACKWSLPLT